MLFILFITERFLEVAIESWPEPTTTEFRSDALTGFVIRP